MLISIILFALLSSFLGKCLSNKIFMGINRRLHDKITKRVLQTNIVFFEENTQGTILNRFSKDVSTMDNMVFTVLEMADVSWFSPFILFLRCTVLRQMFHHSLHCCRPESLANFFGLYFSFLPQLYPQKQPLSHPRPNEIEIRPNVASKFVDLRCCKWTANFTLSRSKKPLHENALWEYWLLDTCTHYLKRL